MLHGIGSRDVDFCVWGATLNDMEAVHSDCVSAGLIKGADQNFSPKTYGGERVAKVIKLDLDIDIIFWGEMYKHWLDIVRDFDCNMSMCVNQPMRTGYYEPIFVGDNYGVLTPNKGIITPVTTSVTRMCRMEEIAELIGWTISDEWKESKAYLESIKRAPPFSHSDPFV